MSKDNKSRDGSGNTKLFSAIVDTAKNDTRLLFDLFNNNPTACVVLSEDLIPMFCNTKACELLQLNSEQDFIENVMGFIPTHQPDGQDSITFYRNKLQNMNKNDCGEFEGVGRTAGGQQIPLYITITHSPVVINGTSTIVCFLQDRREMMKRDERQSIRRINAIVEAFPQCLNLWTRELGNIMCNNASVELFDLSSKEQYCEQFFNLSPEYQPNGRKSAELAAEKVHYAFEHGFCQFYWLHCKLSGEEIPCEITLSRLHPELGEDLVVGFTRDLRPQLVGEGDAEDTLQEYFYDSISDKTLLNILTDLTDELMYVYDIRTAVIQHFGKKSHELNLPRKSKHFPYDIIEQGLIHPDDAEKTLEIAKGYTRGITGVWDLRFKTPDGTYRFYRLTDHTVQNKAGEPIFVVGRAADIDDQKSLEQKARTDLLTGCLNKISSENEIKRIISGSSEGDTHALVMIDIDDFKSINDNLGHHFGDLVLQQVAEKLQKCFRAQDVIGRVGGDEFMVFMRGVKDTAAIEQKAQNITDAFRNTYTGDKATYKVSGSVGIACYPGDGQDYEELSKAADQALYSSKRQGKDCYTFYDNENMQETDGTMMNKTLLENAKRAMRTYTDVDIISVVFNLLYETRDIGSTINAVLGIIGQRMKVDRCYIFETHDEGGHYSNTFEWCADGVSSQIENLQDLPSFMWEDFFNEANEDGIIFSNDLGILKAEGAYEIMKNQGIESFLHSQIRKNDVVQYILGLDDCTSPRVWGDKDISTITYLAKIMSTFLLMDNSQKEKGAANK